MTARALVDLGSLEEAEALLRWVDGCVERTGGHPERLHPLYTVDGYELGAGGGHRHPARVRRLPAGPGRQPRQPPAPARRLRPGRRPARGRRRRPRLGPRRRVAGAGEHGRGGRAAAGTSPTTASGRPACPPRHHVYSKVMCWMTVDRALHVMRQHGGEDRPEWVELRDRIGDNVLEHGWHEQRRGVHASRTATRRWTPRRCGSACPACSPDDDPRFLATVLQGRGGPAQRPGRLPLPLGRRPARPGGRLPHLHGVADRGVPAHRPAGRRRGAVRRR